MVAKAGESGTLTGQTFRQIMADLPPGFDRKFAALNVVSPADAAMAVRTHAETVHACAADAQVADDDEGAHCDVVLLSALLALASVCAACAEALGYVRPEGETDA